MEALLNTFFIAVTPICIDCGIKTSVVQHPTKLCYNCWKNKKLKNAFNPTQIKDENTNHNKPDIAV